MLLVPAVAQGVERAPSVDTVGVGVPFCVFNRAMAHSVADGEDVLGLDPLRLVPF